MRGIEYTWDEKKRVSNLAKHKIDFADMSFFNWEIATIIPDEEYGDRRIATSYMLPVCVLQYLLNKKAEKFMSSACEKPLKRR